MKPIHVFALSLAVLFQISCGQSQTNPAPDHRKSATGYFNKYEYADSRGKRVIIQNGYPRGGTRYIDPDGVEYAYAIFWTQIINETSHPLEVMIDFRNNSFEVPAIPGKHLTILVPPDTMAIEKKGLFNYGLTNLNSFLDRNIHTAASLKRTIKPTESSGFYVVKLSLVSEGPHGGGDVLRTGLVLKGQDLFYKLWTYSSTPDRKPPTILAEKEIPCGRINLKDLVSEETSNSGL